jgi:hypothetical protein
VVKFSVTYLDAAAGRRRTSSGRALRRTRSARRPRRAAGSGGAPPPQTWCPPCSAPRCATGLGCPCRTPPGRARTACSAASSTGTTMTATSPWPSWTPTTWRCFDRVWNGRSGYNGTSWSSSEVCACVKCERERKLRFEMVEVGSPTEPRWFNL